MGIAVLGAGTMGSGIAQLAAMNDLDVVMYDVSPRALARAEKTIDASLARFAAKSRLSEQQVAGIKSLIRTSSKMPEAVADASAIIEAVPEDLELKRRVLVEAAALAPPGALIGTNTSQLSITAIGEALDGEAHRLIGTHFFNPPFLMKFVEIVRGEQTSEATLARARDLAEGLGQEVVVLEKDSPGFITTRISAIVRLECLRILEEGVATPEDIDRACRLGLGFPMGPIELGDFNGLDTYLKALESLEATYGERFRATDDLRELVAAGHFGKKTGRGFYIYDDDGQRVGAKGADG